MAAPSQRTGPHLAGQGNRNFQDVMQKLQDEQEAVQKRTFTKWINSYLALHKPPMVVDDLFKDLRDGVKLIALLEVLTGERLPHEHGRQLKRIHALSNIGTALKFIEERRIKLVNINAPYIADGKPSIVLGLIWTIILYFQINPVITPGSSDLEDSDGSGTRPPDRRPAHTTPKKALLKWVQLVVPRRVDGVEIRDFGASWRTGIAFHLMIQAIQPQLVNLDQVTKRSNRENLEEAFKVADVELGIPRLLDPEDVDMEKPDEKSIMTYVAQFLKHYPNAGKADRNLLGDEPEDRRKLNELQAWINRAIKDLSLQATPGALQEHYQAFRRIKVPYEDKKNAVALMLRPPEGNGKLSVEQSAAKKDWDLLSAKLWEWQGLLDRALPPPLTEVGAWLHRVETALGQAAAPGHDEGNEAVGLVRRQLEIHREISLDLEKHRRVVEKLRRSRAHGLDVSGEQLDDLTARLSRLSETSSRQLPRLDYLHCRHNIVELSGLAEAQLKAWTIKYGRREAVELLLHNYIDFIEGKSFFEQYEAAHQNLTKCTEVYLKTNVSPEGRDGARRFLTDVSQQWRGLTVELRGARSMLEEVLLRWGIYCGTVESLQAWLESGECMTHQPDAAQREFFRDLPQWIQQHTAMNEAGNFLIEACEAPVSRELKQQLLLLNGRWRELFDRVKQYARADEVDRLRQEYADGLAALQAFVSRTQPLLAGPPEAAPAPIAAYLGDLETMRQRIPSVETQFKAVSKLAQVLVKDTADQEVEVMLEAMTVIKDQIVKAREQCPVLAREAQQLASTLDELETGLADTRDCLSRASQTIGGLAPGASKEDAMVQHKEVETATRSCQKALARAERGLQAVRHLLATSRTLQHLDVSPQEAILGEARSAVQAIGTEAPGQLARVRFEEEQERFVSAVQRCEMQLATENRALSSTSSEQLLRDHREFFSEAGAFGECRVRLAAMREALSGLPPGRVEQGLRTRLTHAEEHFQELQEYVTSTAQQLRQHPDKWRDFNFRFVKVKEWLTATEASLGEIQSQSKRDDVFDSLGARLQALSNERDSQNSEVSWLKMRLDTLTEFCSKEDISNSRSELQGLSGDLAKLQKMFIEVEAQLAQAGEVLRCRREVHTVLQDIGRSLQEAQAEAEATVQAATLDEAQDMWASQQKHVTALRGRRPLVEQLLGRAQALKAQDEGVRANVKQLRATLHDLGPALDQKEQEIKTQLHKWQCFEEEKASLHEFLGVVGSAAERRLQFSSPENLDSELQQATELLLRAEGQVARAADLREAALAAHRDAALADALRSDAGTLHDKLAAATRTLANNIDSMQQVRSTWEGFLRHHEEFAAWISEKEVQLRDAEGPGDTAQTQLHKTQALLQEIEARQSDVSALETESQALAPHVRPAEASHAKARLAQLARRTQELQALALAAHASSVEAVALGDKFEAELQQDVSQALEVERGRLGGLAGEAPRVRDDGHATEEVSALQQRYHDDLALAADKQQRLEEVLAAWQRFEKERSGFVVWLERSEAAACPRSPHLPADHTRLDSDILHLKELRKDAEAREAQLASLDGQVEELLASAPADGAQELLLSRQLLRARWEALPGALAKRMSSLQDARAAHQQFEETLEAFSEWILQFQATLQGSSGMNISDLQSSAAQIKDQMAAVSRQKSACASMEAQVTALSSLYDTRDAQALAARSRESLNLFHELSAVSDKRVESLEKLTAFLDAWHGTEGRLQRVRASAGQQASAIDRAKADHVNGELDEMEPALAEAEGRAAELDGLLAQAQLWLREGGADKRLTCRVLAERLRNEQERVRALLSSQLSQAEETQALWQAFQQRKERLLKNIEDIEEKAEKEALKEPTLYALQQRLRNFNQLEKELEPSQQELQWLVERSESLAQRDAAVGEEARQHLHLLNLAWEDAHKGINLSQDQCCALVALMREYQGCKAALNRVVETAEGVVCQKPSRTDREEIRRLLTKHEACRAELTSCQEQLEEFTTRSKQVVSEIRKVHGCDVTALKEETESVLDGWLDVTDRLEESTESLKVTVSLWEDVHRTGSELEAWSAATLAEISQTIADLSNSTVLEKRLLEVQTEVENEKNKVESLHKNIMELQQLLQMSSVPSELQALESDVQQRVEQVEEACRSARGTLREFSSQRSQLESYVAGLDEWLASVQSSLTALAASPGAQHVQKAKEVQQDLLAQQSNIDAAREHLNGLCRRYHASELEALGARVTQLIRSYETANQLCASTRDRLQQIMDGEFSGALQEFTSWFAEARIKVKDCADTSGDVTIVEEKLQKLKSFLESVPDGEKLLELAGERGDRLASGMPRAMAEQVHAQLHGVRAEWQAFVAQSQHHADSLQDALAELRSCEGELKRLTLWLQQMEERAVTEELGAKKQHIPEKKAEVEKVDDFYQELQKQRESIEALGMELQALADVELSRRATLATTRYHELTAAAREKLRASRAALADHQAFEEAQQGAWAWVKSVRDRLPAIDSTIGCKATLDKRMSQIREILLLKGEGEVKLNLTIGKGERTMQSSSEAGRDAIGGQLQDLRDVWKEALDTSVSCHSRLEAVSQQWQAYLESKAHFSEWLERAELDLAEPAAGAAPLPADLAEKTAQLERCRALLAEAEGRAGALERLVERARELLERTGDASFREGGAGEHRAHFSDVVAVAKGKVKQLEETVREHQLYQESVRDVSDWLHSAKEELQRWADVSGDTAALQRKLSKIKELLASVGSGEERLARARALAAEVKQKTAASGCEAVERELSGLEADWRAWEGAARQVEAALEQALGQALSSEREFNAMSQQLESELARATHILEEALTAMPTADESGDTDEEVVDVWRRAQEAQKCLKDMESLNENIKAQLGSLCKFPQDVSAVSERVSSIIRDCNRACLQGSQRCLAQEKALESRFRSALRDVQLWMAQARASLAQGSNTGVAVVTDSLQKTQEVLSQREEGQSKLNTLVSKGELLMSMLGHEEAGGVQAELASAREEWKALLGSLNKQEAQLQGLQEQLEELEASAAPVQKWLAETETALAQAADASAQADLPAKRQLQRRLQVSDGCRRRPQQPGPTANSSSAGSQDAPALSAPRPGRPLAPQLCLCLALLLILLLCVAVVAFFNLHGRGDVR